MQRYKDTLTMFETEGRLRKFPSHVSSQDNLIDLTSNDYMGLGVHSSSIDIESLLKEPPAFTSSASRLLATNQSPYIRLETLLEHLYGKSTLIFNSGYHANVGIIQALSATDTTIFSDKLVHASIIDGIRLSKAKFHRFPHNDVEKLRELIDHNFTPGNGQRFLVVTESVFSMDGDMAPLRELVALKKEYPEMLLYIDEAHGLGIRGARGLGLAEELGLIQEIDVLIGTFGKAVASIGAFCVADPMIIQYLINTARSLIFSTSLPPVNIEWTRLNLQKLLSMGKERAELERKSNFFARQLKKLQEEAGMDSSLLSDNHSTPIVPFVVGDAGRAVALSQALRENGILALPIRKPTVAAGTERIRFSLNTTLSVDSLEKVVASLKSYLYK